MELEGELSCFQISALALILNLNLDNLPHYFFWVLIFFYHIGRVIPSDLCSQVVNFEKLDYPSS